MKQNLLLALGIIAAIILIVNGTKRILFFHENAKQVQEAQVRLDKAKAENEKLKRELDYKKSDAFAEEEIRNKLGMVKDKEQIVLVAPEKKDEVSVSDTSKEANWQKWRKVFFGS